MKTVCVQYCCSQLCKEEYLLCWQLHEENLSHSQLDQRNWCVRRGLKIFAVFTAEYKKVSVFSAIRNALLCSQWNAENLRCSQLRGKHNCSNGASNNQKRQPGLDCSTNTAHRQHKMDLNKSPQLSVKQLCNYSPKCNPLFLFIPHYLVHPNFT